MANESSSIMPKKILNVIFGIILGLFVGLFVLGTLIRLLFDAVFGWGDSGPFWGVALETLLIIGVTALSVYYTVKWTTGSKREMSR